MGKNLTDHRVHNVKSQRRKEWTDAPQLKTKLPVTSQAHCLPPLAWYAAQQTRQPILATSTL